MAFIGDILRKHNLITEEQRSHALALQQKHGSRIGDILISEGIIGYYALYQAIAEHFSLPFVDLLKQPPDLHLLMDSIPPESYLRHMLLPWRRQRDGTITVAVTEFNQSVVDWCQKQFGDDVLFVFTSPFDIRRVVEQHFGPALETSSRLRLWQHFPHMSARTTLAESQKQWLYLLLSVILFFSAFLPVETGLFFIAFCHVAFAISMMFKCVTFIKGLRPIMEIDWPAKLVTLDEKTLPIYTILVPMYRETESLPHMLESLKSLDYPPSKLDIKLVLEADDQETLQAAYALKPSHHFDIIRVPASAMRTKPKVCN
jgi:hypothetical protein